MPPNEAERVLKVMADYFERGELFMRFENIKLHKDGRIIVLETSGIPIIDENGQLTGYIGIDRDVTERKRIEMKQRAAEEKYRSIFENSIEGIFRSTPEGIFLDANPAFARMLGYDSPMEMMAVLNYQVKPIYLHPKDRQRWISKIEQQDHVICEAQMRKKDGNTCWIYLSIRAVRDSEGITTYYEGFSTDITDRKRAEEALKMYAAEISDLYEDAPCGYHSLSDDGTILRMNDTALSWLGYSRDEVI